MKKEIQKLICQSIEAAKLVTPDELSDIQIEISRTKNPDYGQFSCNIALRLSKKLGLNALDLAHQIIDNIKNKSVFLKTHKIKH